MTYQATFTGWDDLTIEDLLVAYRKAKADSFFENTFPVAIKFAEYEQELLENLQKLLNLLQSEDGFSSNKKLIGKFRLLPKKLTTKKNMNPKMDTSTFLILNEQPTIYLIILI